MSGLATHDAVILVIDDEESLRDACTQALVREGYEVLVAANGEEGLELAARRRPDIVFLDLSMPKMGGMAVLDGLAECSPDSIKVVITAYATVSSAMEAVRHGAYDFLPKPFTPEELRVIAARALERRGLVLRNQELAAERDQAKRRFLDLVTGEVRRPVTGALAKLRQLEAMLGDEGLDRYQARELAREAAGGLNRLMGLVDRWQAGGNNGAKV